MMTRFSKFMTSKSPLLMIASIMVGFALPSLAQILRPWVVPVSVIMVPLSVLRIDMTRLSQVFRAPLLVILAALMVLIGLPVIVGLIAFALGLPPWVSTGLVLISAAPPLSSAAAFAILLRIDAALVTAISLTATLLAPLTLWLITTLLPGMDQGLNTTSLVVRLAGFIGLAFAAAFAIRWWFGTDKVNRAAPQIEATTVLLMLVIGVGVMHEIGQSMRQDPTLWARLFGTTWALSVLSCALSACVFWGVGRDFALATGVVAAIKNIALMVAAIAPVVDPQILLVVMTAQLPIFFAPIILRPIFGHLSSFNTRKVL